MKLRTIARLVLVVVPAVVTPVPAFGQEQPEVDRFLDAIRAGNMAQMNRFYERHDTVNVSTPGIYGPEPRTAFVAVESERAEVVRWLIDRGMDVDLHNHPDGYAVGFTPISRAVAMEDVEIVRLLLEAGASLDRGEPVATAVEAGNVELVQMLIDAGADPDSQAALRVGAATNAAKTLQVLLEAGADPNNGAPLTTAAFWDSDEAFRVLRDAGADPTQLGRIGMDRVRTWMHEGGIHPTYGEVPEVSANAAQVEWLQIEFATDGFSAGWALVSAIEVEGGYLDERWFWPNNRLARARLVLDSPDEEIHIELSAPDEMAPVRVEFGPHWVRSVRVEVLETYTGNRWDDLPIAEVRFYAPVAGVNGGPDRDVLIPLEDYPRPEITGWVIE